MRPPLRLRWQLTLSHLVAIAVTLLLMAAAIVLVASAWGWLQSQGGRDAVPEARVVARSVAGMIAAAPADGPAAGAELSAVLGALVDGRLRLLDARAAYLPEGNRWAESAGPSLQSLRYAVVLRPDGAVLASSDPSGAAFAPPEREQ